VADEAKKPGFCYLAKVQKIKNSVTSVLSVVEIEQG
jgi:hypothetical protein